MKVDAERSCWSAGYVLAHCERYRVESAEGTLGYVDEVLSTEDGAELLALLVRSGGRQGGRFTISIEDVLELHPSGERIVVRGRPSVGRGGAQARPALRARPPRRSSSTVELPTR